MRLSSATSGRVVADAIRLERVYSTSGGSTVVGTAKVAFGKVDTVAAGLGSPWTVTVPRGQQVQTAAQIKPDLEAPIAKGAVIGKVVASSNGKPLAEAPLVAQADVERAGFMLRAWQHVTKLFGK